jgi:soluble lytic murein transglycosylase-like protein
VQRVLRQVRYNVHKTRLTITEEYLARQDIRTLLRPREQDAARARVAAGWLYYGRPDKAFGLADPAAERSGTAVPRAQWIAGLAAWHQGRYDPAVAHFQALANNPHAVAGQRTAGAYWAARGLLRLERPGQVSTWLRKAAQRPRTFYGLIAHAALGIDPRLTFADEPTGTGRIAALARKPAVRRAIALMEVGELSLARRELLGVEGWRRPETAAALLTIAERGGLAAFALRLGRRLAHTDGAVWPEATVNAALYPIPAWRPAGGYRVDRALLYALMRTESGFDPDATSGAGARGLLQLMPSTATYIARRADLRYPGRGALHRPAVNIELAQRYIRYLQGYDWVGDNLAALAAAYNGGPGNLLKWRRRTDTEDPLLFVECLPSRETRNFIERVLTNFWIYRLRMGHPTPSLQAIAAGSWPRYESLDQEPREVALQ